MWPRRGPGPLTRPAKKGDGCRGGRRRQDGLRHRGKRRRRGGWAVGGKAPRPPPQPRVEGGKPIKAQGSAQTGVLHQTRTTRDVSGAHGSARIGGTVKRADWGHRKARRFEASSSAPIRPVPADQARARRNPSTTTRRSFVAPPFERGSLLLPHFGDWTQRGHPSVHGQLSKAASVASIQIRPCSKP